MKPYLHLRIVIAVLFSMACAQSLRAQTNPAPTDAAPPPAAGAQRSAAELEKLVQPIALHPDPLIAILLPASVYPLEIVQAARFVKDTNNIAKVDEQSWDENVKAVAKFPDLIAKMDADLPWTVELGQAFLDQRKELMDTIQALRGKAHKAGTLQNSSQQVITVTNVVVVQTNLTQVVTVTNQIVQVQPSNPEVIYVPTYPPTVYYPPPSYVYNPVAPLVSFGVGMAWGAVLANNCDWGHGDVDIDIDHNVNRNVDRNVNRNQNANRTSTSTQSANRSSTGGKQKWQPDQSRLSKSGAPSAQASSREARGWDSGGGGGAGGARPTTGSVGSRPSTGTAGAARPTTGNAGAARPTTGNASTRPTTSASRPAASQSSTRPSSSPAAGQSGMSRGSSGSSGSSAFGGVSSGSNARSQSSRGSASRGGGGGSRGGGGRGR